MLITAPSLYSPLPILPPVGPLVDTVQQQHEINKIIIINRVQFNFGTCKQSFSMELTRSTAVLLLTELSVRDYRIEFTGTSHKNSTDFEATADDFSLQFTTCNRKKDRKMLRVRSSF